MNTHDVVKFSRLLDNEIRILKVTFDDDKSKAVDFNIIHHLILISKLLKKKSLHCYCKSHVLLSRNYLKGIGFAFQDKKGISFFLGNGLICALFILYLLDDKVGTAENKTSKEETSSKDSSAGPRAASGPAVGFPSNPFDFLGIGTDISLDPQVSSVSSVEVLVKALLMMSPAALKHAPDSFVKILLCSHHPCVVGSAKRDVVWKGYDQASMPNNESNEDQN